MNENVIWSARAKADYRKTIIYLIENWSLKEVRKFTEQVASVMLKIIINPEIGTATKNRSTRRLVLSKHTTIHYKIENNTIHLISLWANRRNPKKLKLFIVAESKIKYGKRKKKAKR